jgi:maltose/moltooligosaccharide transporter
MSTSFAATPPPAAAPKIFSVGTLKYTQKDIYVLFFWLMWNDFTLMLLEQVNSFGGFLQLQHGATNEQIAIFGTIGSLLTFWINPVFSVWSDRTRTRWGRRRPFLIFITPPLALCILAIPYMATVNHWLALHSPRAVSFFHAMGMDGAVFLIGVCTILLSFFNAMVLALFSYLYWDVVPQEVLGRWTALSKIVSNGGIFLWGIFLIGYADRHMKTLCVSVSVFCLVVYLVSIWKVKEGGYPPPDKHKKGGKLFAPVRAYFVECYSDPFYLWIFAAFFVAGMANASNGYKSYYLKFDLHTNYETFGRFNSLPYLVPIILGYFFGSIADKLHPIRVFAPTYFFWGLVSFGSYFFIHDKWSFLFWSGLTQVAIFANGVTYGALLPEIYPREKLGQFCSANQLWGTLGGIVVPIPVGWLFDAMHKYYRFAYLFSAVFLFGAALMFRKVERNYMKRKGHVPVPHAG